MLPETAADPAIKIEEAVIGMIAIETALEIENAEDVPGLEVWRDAKKEEIGGVVIVIEIATMIDETTEIGFPEIDGLDLLIEIEEEVAVDLTENLENAQILETRELLVL